jgi:hypothetical protein
MRDSREVAASVVADPNLPPLGILPPSAGGEYQPTGKIAVFKQEPTTSGVLQFEILA